MRFNINLASSEDLEQFRSMYRKLLGNFQIQYDLHVGKTIVRVRTNDIKGAQLITVGFFSFTEEEKDGHTTKSLTQIHPLVDKRYRDFECIQKFWEANPSQPLATLTHTADETESALDTVCEMLRYVYKFEKLKAFW